MHHYIIIVEPKPELFCSNVTRIVEGRKTYIFEGFSVFFHRELPEIFPQYPVSQWSHHFQIKFVKEDSPIVIYLIIHKPFFRNLL